MLFMRLGGWPRTVGLEPSTLNVRIWRTDIVLLFFKSFTLTFKLKLQLELVTLLLVSFSLSSSSINLGGLTFTLFRCEAKWHQCDRPIFINVFTWLSYAPMF